MCFSSTLVQVASAEKLLLLSLLVNPPPCLRLLSLTSGWVFPVGITTSRERSRHLSPGNADLSSELHVQNTSSKSLELQLNQISALISIPMNTSQVYLYSELSFSVITLIFASIYSSCLPRGCYCNRFSFRLYFLRIVISSSFSELLHTFVFTA